MRKTEPRIIRGAVSVGDSCDLNSDLSSPFMPMKGNDDMIACARQMLRIARRKFFTKPYDAMSMEEIATRAGLSEAKAFDLFASQEELFASLVVQEMAAAAIEIWCSTKAASASFRPATGAITAMHHRPPSSDALRRRRRLAARQSIDRERVPRVKHAKAATSSTPLDRLQIGAKALSGNS